MSENLKFSKAFHLIAKLGANFSKKCFCNVRYNMSKKRFLTKILFFYSKKGA